MKVSWHQGGLHIHPENEREGRVLSDLFGCLAPLHARHIDGTGSGESSTCEELLNYSVANHQILPRRNAIKSSHKKPVIVINKSA